MQFDELDSKSSKILKLFLKHGALSIDQLCALLNEGVNGFAGHVAILLRKDYLQNTDPLRVHDNTVYEDGCYRPTTQGRIYFELRTRFWLRSVMTSVLAPIVVSVVTTLITLWIKGLSPLP